MVSVLFTFQQLTMRSLPDLEDDHRIRRLLTDFDKRYTGQDFNALQNKSSGTVSLEQMDGVRQIQIKTRSNLIHFV